MAHFNALARGDTLPAFISRLNSIHVSFLMYYVNLNIFTRFNGTCMLGFGAV